MTTHIAIFVGAGPSLSTQFVKLAKSFSKTVTLAPTPPKGERGTTKVSIDLAIDAVWSELKESERHDTFMSLSVWAVEPAESNLLDYLLREFGMAGWIELLPMELASKDGPTLQVIRKRMATLPSLMAPVSAEVYARRRTSPLPLPFQNFRCRNLMELNGLWYRGLDTSKLEAKISTVSHKFKQSHTRSDGAHHDDRKLAFAPAKNNECHGRAHPTGSTKTCFINGRFRFGSALYPGFHYDVRAERGTLACILYDCEGRSRDLRSENREYINIFPNSVLLPAL
jgi:hypothetical protein